METVRDTKILDEEGQVITTFDELENKLPQSTEYVYHFENAYIDTRYWGQMKIKEVKYAYIDKRETKVFAIDARELIKAIFKDALSGEIKLIAKKHPNI